MTEVLGAGHRAAGKAGDAGASGKTRAWDGPTRLFHWSLVTLVVAAWASFQYAPALGDATLWWHRQIGLALVVLVVFRLIWGVTGSTTARWRFVVWPWQALPYLAKAWRGRAPKYLGHNPAGGWMVLVLLGLLAMQGGLGLYALEHNDIAAGPLQRTIDEDLSKRLTSWHVWLFYVLIGVACLHALVNAAYQMLGETPLITAMITGSKPVADYVDHPRTEGGSWGRAGICLAASMGLVFGTIALLGGRVF